MEMRRREEGLTMKRGKVQEHGGGENDEKRKAGKKTREKENDGQREKGKANRGPPR